MNADREFALTEPRSGLDDDSSAVGGTVLGGAVLGGPGLLRSLWRFRYVIIAAAAVGAVAGLVLSLLVPARYEAAASLLLRDPGSPAVLTLDGSSRSGDHSVFMAQQAEIAGSDAVLGRALQILKRGGTPGDLRSSVEIAPSADLASLTVHANGGRPAEAVGIANAVGVAYEQVGSELVAADSRDELARLRAVRAVRESELDSLRAQAAQAARAHSADVAAFERKALHVANLIGALQLQEDEIAAQAALYGSGVQMFQPAAEPTSPSSPGAPLLALLGGALGLVAAGAWAGRDPRVEADDDAGIVLGVPLLGAVPKLEPLAAEAYHIMLAAVERALSRSGGKAVAVASATPGEGRTGTVLNLALAARREGRRVLLIDADERTHRLSRSYRGGEPFDVVRVRHDDGVRPAVADTGTVLQIGPGEANGHHPAQFFRSAAFRELLTVASDPVDLVLIDTPALIGVSESVAIADYADAVLLVVDRGTALADLRRAGERLASIDTPLIGYVLNRAFGQRVPASGGAAPAGTSVPERGGGSHVRERRRLLEWGRTRTGA